MSADSYSIAVYGACGAVGREVLTALEGEGLDVRDLIPVGATMQTGMQARWRSRQLQVKSGGDVDVHDIDAAVLAVPGGASDGLRPALRAADVFLIDLGAGSDLPLLWPGLTDAVLEEHPGGVAVPGSAASTLAPLLAAVAPLGTLAAVDATVLASASAAGKLGETALSSQTLALLSHRVPEPGPFSGVLAFNAMAGSAWSDGAADPEEARVTTELRTLVPAAAQAEVRASVVQVALFAGTGIATTLRFAGDAPTLESVAKAIDRRPDLARHPGQLAVRDAAEVDPVLVGQLQQDPDGAIRCFLAADGLHRTGEAVGAIMARVIGEDLW